MKYWLDVNLLIASIVQSHSKHARTHAWLAGRQVVPCPIVELGFLRITTNNRSIIGLTMEVARERLQRFAALRQADRIPDDLPALASHALTHDKVTDHYLADLAAKYGFKFGTLDAGISHPSAELVS